MVNMPAQGFGEPEGNGCVCEGLKRPTKRTSWGWMDLLCLAEAPEGGRSAS